MRVTAKSIEDPMVQAFARAVEAAGGKALLVGGLVRDSLLGISDSKDYDFEVFGLPMEKVNEILEQFGNVKEVGQQFGVLNIQELDWDVALPRREQKTGEGHRGFDVVPDPTMSIEDAARRRDFTINAMSMDPLTGEVIDPLNGAADLKAGILRMSDPNTFGDDPLRALRAAQFAARFDFDIDPATLQVIAAQPLEELPGERILPEFSKMLLKGKKPSKGIETLREANLLRYFPEIEALQGVPQDAIHHPEGDVYVHTLMVLDEAAKQRTGDPAFDLPLMLGALSHDFGKPEFTQHVEDRIKSHGHEEGGEAPAREFLQRMKAPHELTDQVATLVSTHLRPQLMAGTGGRKGYRKLGRLLADANVSPELLAAVSTADSLGRTTDSALRRDTSRQDQFLQEYNEHVTSQAAPGGKLVDSVSGKHLISKGFKPGPDMGKFLALTRSIEDETGITDPDKLIDLAARFLNNRSDGGGSQEGNENDCGDSHIREGEECFDGDYREERKKGNTKSGVFGAGHGPSDFRTHPDKTQDDYLLWDLYEWPADKKGKSEHPGLAGVAVGDPRPCYPGEDSVEDHCNDGIAPPAQSGGSGAITEQDVLLIHDQARLQHAESPEQLKGLTDAWNAAKSAIHQNPEFMNDPVQAENFALQLAATIEPRNNKGYRKVPVTFGPGKPPALDPGLLPRAMEGLFGAYADQVMEPDEWYHEFEKVHPLEDGNGRLGDILWKMDKVRRGEPWPETHPPDFFGTDKSDYTANLTTAEPQRLHRRSDNYPGVKDFDRGSRFSEHPLEGPFGRDGFGGSTPLPQDEIQTIPNGQTPETGIFPDAESDMHGQPQLPLTHPHEHEDPELPATDPHDFTNVDFLDWDTPPTADIGPDSRQPLPGADEFPKSEYPNDKGAGFLATELPIPQMLESPHSHPSPARAGESPPSSFPGQMVRKPGGGGLDRAPMIKPRGAPQETGFMPIQNAPEPGRNMFKAELDPEDVHGPGGNDPGGSLTDRGRGGRGGGTKRRDYWDMDFTGKKSGFMSIEPPEENVYPAATEAARTMEDLMDIDAIFPKEYSTPLEEERPGIGPSLNHRNQREVPIDPIQADDDANIEQKQVQPLIPHQKMAIAVDPKGPMGERIVVMSPLFEEASPAIMALRSHRFERHGGIVIDGPPEWLIGITPRLEALDKSSGHHGADDLFARVQQLIQSAGMPIEYEQDPRP